jgi:hypothetical protein
MNTLLGSSRMRLVALTTSLALLLPSIAYAQPADVPPTSTPAPAPAKREPTAGDLATARTALREGLVLREKGELQDALARLGSAYDLVPTPVTGFELGKTHMMMGHVLQAHELFKKVIRMPPSMEESSRSQMARDEAVRLAKELEPRIPTLRLKLTLPHGASAVVKVDDEVIPMTGAETMRAVDPGPHEVTAKAGDGPEEKVHVDVAESETKDVALAPTWVPPKAPPPGKGRDVIFVRQTNPLAFVGFGIAAAGLIATTVSALVYIDARDDAKGKCGSSFCPPAAGRDRLQFGDNTVVDTRFQGDNTRYQVSSVIMVAAGISTLVFFGVGIFGAARPVKERVTVGSTPLTPSIGLGRLGLTGTF